MATTAIILVLVSAFFHAGWNLISRRARPDEAFYVLANIAAAAVLLPVALLNIGVIFRMQPLVGWSLLATGFFQAIYFTGVAGAYRLGELSVSYPILRAIPTAAVPVVVAIFGFGAPMHAIAVAGIALAVAGMIVLPLTMGEESSRPARRRNLDRPSLEGRMLERPPLARPFLRRRSATLRFRWVGWTVLAAAGTTGYTIIDSQALNQFRMAVSPARATVMAPLAYAFVECLSTTLWLVAGSVIVRRLRRFRRSGNAGSPSRTLPTGAAIVSGVGMIAAYGLILISFGFVSNVSYVAALRQASLPIGAVLAVAVLRERMVSLRAVGNLLVVAGLVLVAIM